MVIKTTQPHIGRRKDPLLVATTTNVPITPGYYEGSMEQIAVYETDGDVGDTPEVQFFQSNFFLDLVDTSGSGDWAFRLYAYQGGTFERVDELDPSFPNETPLNRNFYVLSDTLVGGVYKASASAPDEYVVFFVERTGNSLSYSSYTGEPHGGLTNTVVRLDDTHFVTFFNAPSPGQQEAFVYNTSGFVASHIIDGASNAPRKGPLGDFRIAVPTNDETEFMVVEWSSPSAAPSVSYVANDLGDFTEWGQRVDEDTTLAVFGGGISASGQLIRFNGSQFTRLAGIAMLNNDARLVAYDPVTEIMVSVDSASGDIGIALQNPENGASLLIAGPATFDDALWAATVPGDSPETGYTILYMIRVGSDRIAYGVDYSFVEPEPPGPASIYVLTGDGAVQHEYSSNAYEFQGAMILGQDAVTWAHAYLNVDTNGVPANHWPEFFPSWYPDYDEGWLRLLNFETPQFSRFSDIDYDITGESFLSGQPGNTVNDDKVAGYIGWDGSLDKQIRKYSVEGGTGTLLLSGDYSETVGPLADLWCFAKEANRIWAIDGSEDSQKIVYGTLGGPYEVRYDSTSDLDRQDGFILALAVDSTSGTLYVVWKAETVGPTETRLDQMDEQGGLILNSWELDDELDGFDRDGEVYLAADRGLVYCTVWQGGAPKGRVWRIDPETGEGANRSAFVVGNGTRELSGLAFSAAVVRGVATPGTNTGSLVQRGS